MPEGVFLRGGVQVGDVVAGESLLGEGRWAGWKRLGGPGAFTGKIGRGHGAFFDREDGTAAGAIKEEEVTSFGGLRGGGDASTALADGSGADV